jgi:hypothetical protein
MSSSISSGKSATRSNRSVSMLGGLRIMIVANRRVEQLPRAKLAKAKLRYDYKRLSEFSRHSLSPNFGCFGGHQNSSTATGDSTSE